MIFLFITEATEGVEVDGTIGGATIATEATVADKGMVQDMVCSESGTTDKGMREYTILGGNRTGGMTAIILINNGITMDSARNPGTRNETDTTGVGTEGDATISGGITK